MKEENLRLQNVISFVFISLLIFIFTANQFIMRPTAARSLHIQCVRTGVRSFIFQVSNSFCFFFCKFFALHFRFFTLNMVYWRYYNLHFVAVVAIGLGFLKICCIFSTVSILR